MSLHTSIECDWCSVRAEILLKGDSPVTSEEGKDAWFKINLPTSRSLELKNVDLCPHCTSVLVDRIIEAKIEAFRSRARPIVSDTDRSSTDTNRISPTKAVLNDFIPHPDDPPGSHDGDEEESA